MDIWTPELDSKELIDWYDKEHLPILLECKSWIAGQLKGSPQRPLTEADLGQKLRSAFDGLPAADKQEMLQDAVGAIAEQGPLPMMQVLRALEAPDGLKQAV